MTALDYILDGLEAALELERELGVRAVEIDRALVQGQRSEVRGQTKEFSNSTVRPSTSSHQPFPPAQTPKQLKRPNALPLVFLHDRPLSEKGVEMMAKIFAAMGLSAGETPIVVAPPAPKAKIVVVLGGRALKKYFPEMRGEPGQWQRTSEGADALITYSPEYILRFATVTPAVQKIKADMWRSLKAVKQRLQTIKG